MRGPRSVFSLFWLASAACCTQLLAGSFNFPTGNTSFFADSVVHPEVYASGIGGNLQYRGCIDPASNFFLVMQLPTQRAFETWNALVPTTENIIEDLPEPPAFDFESVLLHELGHALGFAHPVLALGTYSRSRAGADMGFCLNPGADGVQGSSDDIRGDDTNLVWYVKSTNDPFAFNPSISFDIYSREEDEWPGSHNYAANGNRAVAGLLLGSQTTQVIMSAGIAEQERIRELTMDDVAMLGLGELGLDRVISADDYLLELVVSEPPDCDFLVTFEPDLGVNTLAQTQFATEDPILIAGRHYYRDVVQIVFNEDFAWFFNPTLFASGFETGDTSEWDDAIPAFVDPKNE